VGRTLTDPLWGAPSPSESRVPASLAVLMIVGLQFATPDALHIGPRWMWPLITLPLVATLLLANPVRLTHESREMRTISMCLIGALIAANATALALLMNQLIAANEPIAGRTLLLSAVGIWARNVLAFAVWFWEVDRGGPVRRCTEDHDPPDFLFPQMQSPAVSREPWSPRFGDYLYVSITNSTAFSPTDTMPLTARSKVLMGAEALTSFATIVVVGARAVNILR
jgi:hypothetical protein